MKKYPLTIVLGIIGLLIPILLSWIYKGSVFLLIIQPITVVVSLFSGANNYFAGTTISSLIFGGFFAVVGQLLHYSRKRKIALFFAFLALILLLIINIFAFSLFPTNWT